MFINSYYIFFLVLFFLNNTISPQSLTKAHSHNDYNQKVPLLGALELGFSMIEVDIHLKKGKLLVGHDEEDLSDTMTIHSLYLEPLIEIIHKNNNSIPGYIKPLNLLVDIKTDAYETLLVLNDELKKYHEFISRYHENILEEGLFKIIISGNRNLDYFRNNTNLYVFLDGRPNEINKFDHRIMPLVSSSIEYFGDVSDASNLPDSLFANISNFVNNCNNKNIKTRLWGVPDDPIYYAMQTKLNLDFIGTDNLSLLNEYFLSQKENKND